MNMEIKKSWLSRNWKKLLIIILTPILAVTAYVGNIVYQLGNVPYWEQHVEVQDGLVLYGEDLGMHGLRDVFRDPEARESYRELEPVFVSANQNAVALREQGIVTSPASNTDSFYNLYVESNNRQSWAAFAGLSDETRLGMSAPDFDLQTTEGDNYRLSDSAGKIRVFMLAAITCQPALYQVMKWSELKKKYASDDVEFTIIYSVERHAGEADYREFSWPSNFDEKMAYAKMLGDYTDMTIAVDNFDAKVLRTYGNVPNPAYVVDEKGRIVFRAAWADSKKIEFIVDEMIKRKAEEELL